MSSKKSSESSSEGSPLLIHQSVKREQELPLYHSQSPFPPAVERLVNYLMEKMHPDPTVGMKGILFLKAVSPQMERLQKLDPDKFYVENVRAILETSTRAAQEICERGVQEGLFDQQVEVLDPETNRTLETASSEAELPHEVVLETGFHNEDEEPKTVLVSSLKKLTYYSLHQK